MDATNTEFDDTGFTGRLTLLMGEEKPYKFALRCGISRTSMKAFLERNTVFTGKNLVKIRKATGVSLDWLLTGDGSMYAHPSPRSLMRAGDIAPGTYLPPRTASLPAWLEPVWHAYKRLVKPEHSRWAKNAVLAYQALATEFPHLNLSSEELNHVLTMLNKIADDLPKEAPITLTMVRAWLRQLEEQGSRMSKNGLVARSKDGT